MLSGLELEYCGLLYMFMWWVKYSVCFCNLEASLLHDRGSHLIFWAGLFFGDRYIFVVTSVKPCPQQLGSLLRREHQPNRFNRFGVNGTSDPRRTAPPPSHFHLCKKRFLGIAQTRSRPRVASFQTQQNCLRERRHAASGLTLLLLLLLCRDEPGNN